LGKGTAKKSRRKEKRRGNNDIRGERLRIKRIDLRDRTADWPNIFILKKNSEDKISMEERKRKERRRDDR